MGCSVNWTTNSEGRAFGVDKAGLAVMMVRRGRVAQLRTYELRDAQLRDDELITGFVTEYYLRSSFVPDEVLIPMQLEAAEGLGELLSDQRKGGGRSLSRHLTPAAPR